MHFIQLTEKYIENVVSKWVSLWLNTALSRKRSSLLSCILSGNTFAKAAALCVFLHYNC